jgi:hypothetical protein
MTMPSNRWLDKTQPQTLMMATLLMYVNAGWALLGFLASPHRLISSPFGLILLLVLVIGPVAAGWGVANDRKWGYWLGVVLSVLTVLYLLYYFSFVSIVSLLFYGALVALLLHPQSRAYRRIWFK